jgi:hypothetical protein
MFALLKDRNGGVVGVSEEDGLLVENVYLLDRLGYLGRNQSDEPDLNAGVPQTSACVKGDPAYCCEVDFDVLSDSSTLISYLETMFGKRG